MGLSGSAVTHTVPEDRATVGAVTLLTLSFFPQRKEAFVDPTKDPFFCEAGEEKATAAMAEEAQTVEAIVVSAILCLQELVMKNE